MRWTLLGRPLAGAVTLVQLPLSYRGDHGEGTRVIVYGRYQFVGAYTRAGESAPSFVYRGGVAQATLTWEGSRFGAAGFEPGSVRPPPGIVVAAFVRPGAAGDGAVLAVVLAGFEACVASAHAPNCPQDAAIDPGATGVVWHLHGDPRQGARVSFDARHGNFTVTGSYSMTLDTDGAPSTRVSGRYAATLVFDGAHIRLVAIAAA